MTAISRWPTFRTFSFPCFISSKLKDIVEHVFDSFFYAAAFLPGAPVSSSSRFSHGRLRRTRLRAWYFHAERPAWLPMFFNARKICGRFSQGRNHINGSFGRQLMLKDQPRNQSSAAAIDSAKAMKPAVRWSRLHTKSDCKRQNFFL